MNPTDRLAILIFFVMFSKEITQNWIDIHVSFFFEFLTLKGKLLARILLPCVLIIQLNVSI